MKQTFRNLFVFSSFGLTCLAASGGCSGDPAPAIGTGNTTNTSGTTGTTTGGSSAGSFSTAGTTTTGGTTGTAGTTTVDPTAGAVAVGGTFGSAGTATSTAGSFGTSGTDTGGTATGGGGAGGAGGTTAGTASGGGTGGSATDFPQNCPAPTGTHGTALTKTCWKASATDCSNSGNNVGLQNPPSKALDADTTTRFSTGAKITSDTMFMFEIDMGKAVMINGVGSTTPPPAAGATVNDIPPFIEIDVSTDDNTFTPVACGANALMADISFAPVSARYVRFKAHGTSDAWWSMTDVNVYGASAADVTCGADGGTPACTMIGTANPTTCCGMVHTL